MLFIVRGRKERKANRKKKIICLVLAVHFERDVINEFDELGSFLFFTANDF